MTKVDRLRIGILVALGTLVVIVIGYSTLYVFDLAPGVSMSSEENFRILDRELEAEPIEVIEFFSYTCPFCYALDPMIESWKDGLPNNVQFKRIHVSYDSTTSRLARTYRALQSQRQLEDNHTRIFEAIHEDNKTFLSDQAIADYLEPHGVDREAFLTAFAGRQISRRVQVDSSFVRETESRGVPAMLVANKYLISASGGNRAMLATVDWLIEEINAGRAPSDELTDAEQSADEAEAES